MNLQIRFKVEENLRLLILRPVKSYRWRFGGRVLEVKKDNGDKLSYPAHAIVAVEEV